MSTQTIADDLKAARTELVTRGHARHEFVADNGAVCALGALGIATNKRYLRLAEESKWGLLYRNNRLTRAATYLADYIPPDCPGGTPVMRVWRFNDEHPFEVLDLFDKALADLGALA